MSYMGKDVVVPIKRKSTLKKVPLSPPFSKRDAQELINKAAQDSSKVKIPEGQHAQERGDWRDFTRSEIIEILREGIIRSEPVFVGNHWRYKVEFPRFRARPFGAAVVAILRIEENDIITVTVMWLDS